MADRTSAALFGDLFRLLADTPDERSKALAVKVWEMSGRYDFSPQQMGCCEALVRLGLMRRGIDRDYPQDGETWLYGPPEGP